MKTRISRLYFDDGIIRYTVERKKHWWNKWHFMMDVGQPRLFKLEELQLLGYVSECKKPVKITEETYRKIISDTFDEHKEEFKKLFIDWLLSGTN